MSSPTPKVCETNFRRAMKLLLHQFNVMMNASAEENSKNTAVKYDFLILH